jgi:hypothetical protein
VTPPIGSPHQARPLPRPGRRCRPRCATPAPPAPRPDRRSRRPRRIHCPSVELVRPAARSTIDGNGGRLATPPEPEQSLAGAPVLTPTLSDATDPAPVTPSPTFPTGRVDLHHRGSIGARTFRRGLARHPDRAGLHHRRPAQWGRHPVDRSACRRPDAVVGRADRGSRFAGDRASGPGGSCPIAGHRHSWSSPRRSPSRSSSGSWSRSRSTSSACRSTGHWARSCPSRSRPWSTSRWCAFSSSTRAPSTGARWASGR